MTEVKGKETDELPQAALPLVGTERLKLVQGPFEEGDSRRATLDDLLALFEARETVQSWAVPYRGARLRRTSDLTGISFPVIVPWQTADRDTDSFWSAGDPTVVTIPPGVKKVKLKAGLTLEADGGSGSWFFSFQMDTGGGFFTIPGATMWAIRESNIGFTNNNVFGFSDAIDVNEGDQIRVRLNKSGIGTANEILESAGTWLAIEVVEVTDAEARPFDHTAKILGAVPTSALADLEVATRKYAIQEDGGQSRFRLETAPSDEVVFDVRKDGASIGSITFAASANTGSYSGSRTEFEPGDVRTVHAPANLHGAAGLYFGWRLELV
jgi:hypothetical protein